jgi:hypothetical protein
MSFPNNYHLRRVADTSSKPCFICYKPTSAVLITPDQKDFFYVCLGHLKDRGFAIPVLDPAEEAAKKRKEELDREAEKLKKEYEEKQKKKKKDKKDKDKDKDDKDKDNDKKAEDDAKGKEKDQSDADDADKKDKTAESPAVDDIPRIYTLHKDFYQMRTQRLRNIQQAKATRDRLRNPNTFPAVPSGDL